MKKFIFFQLIIVSKYAIAQYTLGDLYVGTFLQENKDSVSRQDRFVFDVSNEHWLSSPASIKQKKYSFGAGITRMYDFPVARNIAFAFGPGIHWLNHYHNGEFRKNLYADGSIKDTLQPLTGVTYKVNKFVLTTLDLNAELRLRSAKINGFVFYLGFRGSYLVNNHLKYKDSNIKYKLYDIEKFTSITYGPTLRIGISNINLYAHYLLTPVYKNSFNQKISSVSIGLSFFFL